MTLIVVSDQLTKWAVYTFMVPAQSLPVLPPVLHLTYVQNTGGAFGLFQGHPWAFVAVSLIVGGWVMVELSRGRHQARSTQVALAAILGGAIGNLLDRLRLGYVVDFLDLRVWPVFNVADSCITLGVTWLLWQLFVKKHRR